VSPTRSAIQLPELLVHAGFFALAGLLLLAVGQPLFTDDAWWHLAFGEVYARQGPWLDHDPLLFTAPGPPAPAAWLADLALFGVERFSGFAGLRVAHVLSVAAILALAWSLLHRASGSRLAASLATGAFVALSAYRLAQLRPHLFTILAALLLYRLLIEGGAPPSRRRLALAVGLLTLWANVHAGFLMGPVLIAACLGGLLLATPLRAAEQRPRDHARAKRLAAALGLGLLATLANPSGVGQHLAYFAAGAETPALTRVADEWARLDPFRLPVPHLPPSPLAWGLVWGLLAGTAASTLGTAFRWRRGNGQDAQSDVDPALVALAGASLLALLTAVRFVWLGIFPLLLLARIGRTRLAPRGAPGRGAAWAVAAAALLLVPGFLRVGDWPMISRGIPPSWSGYARPYPAFKYHAHAVWLLKDAGLEGNLFNEYYMGGFLGFWLAPELRCFINGTLNVSKDAAEANRPIRERRGSAPEESFLELLDRFGVDLFLGIRLPQVPVSNRPWFYTTAHLERAPGWIPVFRDLSSAVYLRADERNRANLERLADYYAREEVPFDLRRGFEPARVIREARRWAVLHGLVPSHFEALAEASHGLDPARRRQAQDQLASLYATLGLYEHAIRLDRRALRSEPGDVLARRRLVWSLLRLGRAAEALEAAEELAQAEPTDWLSQEIAAAAHRYATLEDAGEAAALVARLPLFTPGQATRIMMGVVPPEPRTERR
jgi:tetratricopeptide (TPR) repeat protein